MTPPSQPTPDAPPRVVLLGRTGLDERLRDSEFQLVRARSGPDAIGALASDGARAVVLGEGAGVEGPAEMQQMVDALRRVRADAVIVPAPPRSGGGAPADAENAMEALRRVIRGDAAPAAPAPSAQGAPAAPAQRPSHDPGEQAADLTLADAELARKLAQGADILGAAIDLLRRRSGDPGLRFVPRSDTADPAAARGSAEAEVVCAGTGAGRLLSDRLSGARLRAAADWLAAWLTLRDQQAQLREAAFTDSLTGAWNRRYFERFLETALREAKRDRHEITLLVFDIDDFKQYNDQYGHGAGDEILIETARLMRSVVRPSDRVCRIGGDEFAVIFNEPDGPREAGSQRPTSIMQIAERFQRQVAAARFPKLAEAAPGSLTVSGGLASFPWDAHDVASLLRVADERALASKRQGKNAITFGGEGPGELAGR